MRDLNRNMLTTAFALALFASATTATAGTDSLQHQLHGVDAETAQSLEKPLTKADWELVLDAMDSLVAELESSAFRPVEPPLDSGIWLRDDAWPKFDDGTLKARLQAIPTNIPLTFNATVRSWIEMYTLRNRGGVQRMLGLRDLYFPIIEAELDKRNLPL